MTASFAIRQKPEPARERIELPVSAEATLLPGTLFRRIALLQMGEHSPMYTEA
jgi:hypothetical protein